MFRKRTSAERVERQGCKLVQGRIGREATVTAVVHDVEAMPAVTMPKRTQSAPPTSREQSRRQAGCSRSEYQQHDRLIALRESPMRISICARPVEMTFY